MKNTTLWLIAALLAMVPGSAQERSLSQTHIEATGRGSWSLNNPPLHPEAANAGTTGNGINYLGGPLMLGTTHIYYIYYGNWSGLDPKGPAILETFATNVGGSPYFGINTTYFDSTQTNVSNSVLFVNKVQSNYPAKTTISYDEVWSIVQQAFAQGLPVDPNGVYFVLTAPGILTPGFMTDFCAFHPFQSYNGQEIKYAFVGNPTGNTYDARYCAPFNGPNNDLGADAMVSQIAHQLNAAVTDPTLGGWLTDMGMENSDLCIWTYGTKYLSNRGYANMKLGAMDFLVQRNWVNANGGYCALSLSDPHFALSVSPSSQSTAKGTTSGAYTVSIVPFNGFNSSVALSASGLPSGAVAKFAPSSTTTSSSLKIAVDNTVAVGTYTFTITGTSGTETHITIATLVVTKAPGSFTISASPNPLTIKRGASGKYAVTITRSGGFMSNLTFSVSGLPSDVTHSFSPNPVTGTTATTTLTISVNQIAVATPGTKITLSASGGGLSASTTATLVIIK